MGAHNEVVCASDQCLPKNVLSTLRYASDRGIETRGGGLVMSARWSPTPEQLEFLEEVYRHGITTPSAEQIRHIVRKLRRFGRIEGKNVFYWFQNHKARERQRKRRWMESLLNPAKQQQAHYYVTGSMKCYGSDQVSAESNSTMHFKYPVTVDYLTKTVKGSEPGWPLESSSFMFTKSLSAKEVFGYENGNLFVFARSMQNLIQNENESCSDTSGEVKDTQTLELFPTRKTGQCLDDDKENWQSVPMTTRPQPTQFFEFFPIREI